MAVINRLVAFPMLFGGGIVPNFLLVRNLKMIDTLWAIVIPGMIATWNVLVMRSFFLAIPYELEEAAKIDGMTEIGVFFKIILPLSKASLATIGLFYAVGYWNNFFEPLIYLNSRDKFPIQIFLRNMLIVNKSDAAQYSTSGQHRMVALTIRYTAIMITTLPIICVYPFIQKYFVKGVMIGSIKG